MTYQDMHLMSNEQLTQLLMEQLGTDSCIRRKELLEKCLRHLGFTEQQMGDQRLDADVVKAKSRLGMVLSACQTSGYITESDIGFLCLVVPIKNTVSSETAKNYILDLLRVNSGMRKDQIYRQAEKDFGTDQTPDRKDDNDLRSILGKVIARLEREEHIVLGSSGYRLAEKGSYRNTELGAWLRKASDGGNIQECFLEAVHAMGGEWFEIYCVQLLENYYRSIGKTVLSASVSGGSADGGIDGVIQTEDWLGYRETILMQMKNRHAIMTQKDIREFYGAVCAEKGTRGIFITVSKFHREAWSLINRVDNLTGIDGEKLFQIACQTRRGICTKDGIHTIDASFFLEE